MNGEWGSHRLGGRRVALDVALSLRVCSVELSGSQSFDRVHMYCENGEEKTLVEDRCDTHQRRRY